MKQLMKITLLAVLFFGFTSCQKESNKRIKWDFNKFEKLTYDYEQVMENDMGESFMDGERNLISSKGQLIVKVKDSGKADVIFKGVEVSMFTVTKAGDTTKEMSQTVPDFFMQDMDEFGKIEGELNQQTELLSHTLFPISTQALSIGDTEDLPISMPFNIYGSRLQIKGQNSIKLNSIEDQVAFLTTEIDVSEYEIPEEVNMNYECYLKGHSANKFDIEKGCFQSINLTIEMLMKASAKEQKEKTEDKQDNRLMDMAKNMSMKMNSTITLNLVDVE